MKNGKITFIGKILRKTGIDELPQLLNIISGQMSFVGPRPLTQFDLDRLGWNATYYNERWNVKPGLTGLAQLSPICHKKMSWFLDQKYCRCQSAILDLKIVFGSSIAIFAGKQTAISLFHKNRR